MVSVEYLAGFIDGEGSLILWRRPRGQSVEYTSRIYLANTNLRILVEIQRDFGGKLVESLHANPHWKRQFSLRWASATAERLLLLVGPYLRVKSKQAAAVLSFSQHRKSAKRDAVQQGRPLLPEDLKIREAFYWRLRALNAKGMPRPWPQMPTPEIEPPWPAKRFTISPEYLAGFIDAEGSLIISRTHSMTQRSMVYRGRISIGCTNWQIINEIHSTFGGIVADQPAAEPHWKNAYLIIWSDTNAESLLSLVGSHLRVKAKQAIVLAEFLRHKRTSDQRAKGVYVTVLSREVLEIREAFYQKMKSLNSRGPTPPLVQEDPETSLGVVVLPRSNGTASENAY